MVTIVLQGSVHVSLLEPTIHDVKSVGVLEQLPYRFGNSRSLSHYDTALVVHTDVASRACTVTGNSMVHLGSIEHGFFARKCHIKQYSDAKVPVAIVC
jgi:hypothetical protein